MHPQGLLTLKSIFRAFYFTLGGQPYLNQSHPFKIPKGENKTKLSELKEKAYGVGQFFALPPLR